MFYDKLEDLEKQFVDEPIKVRGFFRICIVDPGKDGEPDKVAGDSGWLPNLVTNEGKRNYLARLLGALASSSQIGYMALGTGGAPIATDTTLAGEQSARTAVTAQTSGSTAVQFTATFSSAGSFVTASKNLSNVGLFAGASSGTLFAGNTYASSACATNQDVKLFGRPLLVTVCKILREFGGHLFETIPSQAGC